ncbi:hypothetical protein H632_c2915p0, partial [Helicosporidium sp. ATCC 50920]
MPNDGRVYECSTKKFYKCAGYIAYNEKWRQTMADNPTIEKIMRGVPTFKTTNLDEMKTHVRYMAEHLDQLLDFNKRQRNSRFKRELLRRRKIDEITNCLAVAGKDT